MRKQRGLSLLGLLVIGSLVGFFALLGFKALPAYNEYFGIKRIVLALAKEAKNVSPEELRKSFDKRATIDYISTVKGEDLDIAAAGENINISVAYSKEIPIAANIYLLIKFEVSESSGGASAPAGEEKK